MYLKYLYPEYHGYAKGKSSSHILTSVSQIYEYIEVLSLPYQIRDIKVWLYLSIVTVITKKPYWWYIVSAAFNDTTWYQFYALLNTNTYKAYCLELHSLHRCHHWVAGMIRVALSVSGRTHGPLWQHHSSRSGAGEDQLL